MKNISKTIYKYWQKTPEYFSEKYESSMREYFSPVSLFLMLRRRKTLKLAGKLKDKKVLDIACGSGIIMIDFMKRGASVVGLDYSQKMLNIAHQNLSSYGIPKNKYKLLKADATKIPLKKDKFDLIIATGLTDYLSDSSDEEFLKEAARLLKKNGKFIVSFPSQSSPFSFLRTGYGLEIRRRFAKLPPIQNKFDEKKIERFLNIAGFRALSKTKIFSTMWLIVAKKK